MFTDSCDKVAYFRVRRRLLNSQYDNMDDDGNITEMAAQSTC